ncbi:hypothetical protein ACJMK2_037150 [Sinanodonta woodiana]|uniref:Luciferin 4-monooxygenase n=1 Tax=Sinanodonta woodiana TaxID=1069815 RepID=A0ABD3WMX2_SINWO
MQSTLSSILRHRFSHCLTQRWSSRSPWLAAAPAAQVIPLSTPIKIPKRDMRSKADDFIYRSPFPDVNRPKISLAEYMFPRFDKFKKLVAIKDFSTGASFTYGELKDRCIKVASGLTRKGYKKGDVVAYYGINNPEFAMLFLGCAAAGIILTTANPAYTPGELAHHLEHSGSTAIVTVTPLVNNVKEAMATKSLKDVFVIGNPGSYQPFSVLTEDDGKAYPTNVKINAIEDILVLPYSSGTTGLPKGVMLTHFNVVSNLNQCRPAQVTTSEDKNLAVLPFFHIYGMVPILLGTLQDGATIVTLPRFDPEMFLMALQKEKITLLTIAPPIVQFMAKHPAVQKIDLSHLKYAISAAAPLGDALTHEFMHRLKIPLGQGYGLTELSPVTHIDQRPVTVGSIGPLIPNTLAKILDMETGKPLSDNKEGEIWIKGPQVMKGYFRNEKATREMITNDGWLKTGDIGYVRKDGRFIITDRLKELIKYKGFQVAPAELENLLLKHPAIQDAAVIGMPDDQAGELPRAYIVTKPNIKVSAEEIMKYVETNVAAYKKLRGGVEFIKEIPKNPSGKILRRILKERLLSNQT